MPRPADVAVAALLEACRPDLAELVHVFTNDDGTFYLEPMTDLHDGPLTAADEALMERAEYVMNQVCQPEAVAS